MKRAGRILSLVIVTIMLCTAVCFADGASAGNFKLVEAYPKDGATGTAMENVGVKLYFDAEFSEAVLKKIDDLLAAYGTDKRHLIMVQIYLKNMEDFSGLNEVYDKWVEPGFEPARACVEAALAAPQILVEMVVTAVKKD